VSLESRFWAKVTKTDTCWLWTASTSNGGYGQLSKGSRGKVSATRLSWELANGPIPPGLMLDHRHTCPKNCVRPEHLRLVTDGQNKQNRPGANRNSVSGVRGVSPSRGRWKVQVQHQGKSVSGGIFSTIEEAEKAAIALRRQLFTHSDMDVRKPDTQPSREGATQ